MNWYRYHCLQCGYNWWVTSDDKGNRCPECTSTGTVLVAKSAKAPDSQLKENLDVDWLDH